MTAADRRPVPVDPETLHTSPVYAQGMLAPAGPLLFVGGQNGTDAEGNLLDGVEAQSAQAARNVLAVLEAGGTDLTHVVKLTILFVDGVDLGAAYAAVMPVWQGHRCAVSGMRVAGLGRPGALIEIEAIATVPAE